MYYDDQAKRFNVLSGLLFGVVLGAGLALLASPQKEVRVTARRAGRRTKRRGGRTMKRMREGVMEAVVEGLSDAWRRAAPGAR